MKRFFLFLTFLQVVFINLYSADYAIVFVHIGDTLPPYLQTAVTQARAFNKECPIFLIANEKALQTPINEASCISCESLIKTTDHLRFIQKTKLNKEWKKGFWRYTSERFLYLNDFMLQHGVCNVFHIENDVMLYVDLEELLPVFLNNYTGIAATFDNDKRCIPGFVFFKDDQASSSLTQCFADHAKERLTDTEIFVRFREEYPDLIDTLPIVSEEYVTEHPMISFRKYFPKDKYKFCQNIHLFQSFFDAAAIGQYLGGKDPANGFSSKGFINESCVFNPSHLTYEWIFDEQYRRVPYAIYAGKKFRINNLHIHSKQLELFLSL